MNYGMVQIGNKTFAEREQTFPLEVTVTVGLSVIKANVQLPGTADFWLKSLTRETVAAGASAARRFRFRLGNTDGATWYQAGGVGGNTDRVIDTLMFGNGQFPFVVCPYIYYSASASILTEIEDIGGGGLVPYTIFFAFRGSYLIPVGG